MEIRYSLFNTNVIINFLNSFGVCVGMVCVCVSRIMQNILQNIVITVIKYPEISLLRKSYRSIAPS